MKQLQGRVWGEEDVGTKKQGCCREGYYRTLDRDFEGFHWARGCSFHRLYVGQGCLKDQ